MSKNISKFENYYNAIINLRASTSKVDYATLEQQF